MKDFKSDLQETLNEIVNRFKQAQVYKIILFGSLITGNVTEDSDIDLVNYYGFG